VMMLRGGVISVMHVGCMSVLDVMLGWVMMGVCVVGERLDEWMMMRGWVGVMRSQLDVFYGREKVAVLKSSFFHPKESLRI